MLQRVSFTLLSFLTSVTLLSAQSLPPVEAGSLAALTTSPRHGEWVSVSENADRFDAWVVYPERPDPAPVVVLVHEIYGLTDWARAVADAYAAEGFLVIAPDFLTGKAGDGKGGSAILGPDASRAAIAKLDPAEITARLNAAAHWATSQPSATKVFGVVGFCWGGGIAFSWATAQPQLSAAVGFYGTAPTKESMRMIKAPVLGFYGGSDARVTSTLAPFRDEMSRLGKPYESEVYEGAGHAFLRQQDGMNGANRKAAEAAWPRSVAFLKANLEKKDALLPATDQSLMVTLKADDCCSTE